MSQSKTAILKSDPGLFPEYPNGLCFLQTGHHVFVKGIEPTRHNSADSVPTTNLVCTKVRKHVTTTPYLITLIGATMFRQNVFFCLSSEELYGSMHTFIVVIAFYFFIVFFFHSKKT